MITLTLRSRVLGPTFALVLAMATGCKQDAPAPASGSAGQATPAAVRLGYFANFTHAQAVLGVSSGEFAQALGPVKLETRIFNAGPSLIEALFAGELDIGYVGPSPAINGWVLSKGQGLRVIAGAAANGVVIVARKDSGITRLEDLAGKRVGTPQLGNTQDVSAKHYLRSVLKQDQTNNVLAIANAEQLTLFAQGQLDASWAPEPWGSRLIVEGGAVLIAEEKDLWPDKQFGLTMIVTTPEFLARHPDVVEKLLKVHRSWTARLSADPQKHLPALGDALLALTGKKLPPGVLPQAIGRVRFTDDPLEASLQTFADWAFELGLTKSKPNLAGLVDTTLLRKLQAAQP